MVLECIFYAEFDNKIGPAVVYQYPPPDEFNAQELLNTISDYVICPPPLCNQVITVTTGDHKVVGYPQCISGAKYSRHKLSFNICLVFHKKSPTQAWNPAVRKISTLLLRLELESEFLFREEKKRKLASLLQRIRDSLNHEAQCTLAIDDSNVLALKLFPPLPPPVRVKEYDVPVRVNKLDALATEEWDLTMQHIIPYIDSRRYVGAIADEAEVDVSLVSKCIRQLVFYNCVVLIDIFQYSNIYAGTPRIHELLQNEELQRQCSLYVTQQGRPLVPAKRLFELFAALSNRVPYGTICLRHKTSEMGIDDRRFVIFGLVHEFIRRVHKYPVLERKERTQLKRSGPAADDAWSDTSRSHGAELAGVAAAGAAAHDMRKRLYELADGTHHMDEICARVGRSQAELNLILNNEPGFYTVYK